MSLLIVHVPAARSVISKPLAEQIAGVVDASVTGRPELAVGATVIGDSMRVAFGGFTKVIDLATLDTVNDLVTGFAAR